MNTTAFMDYAQGLKRRCHVERSRVQGFTVTSQHLVGRKAALHVFQVKVHRDLLAEKQYNIPKNVFISDWYNLRIVMFV